MGLLHDFIVTDRVDFSVEEYCKDRSWEEGPLTLKNRNDIKGYFAIHDDLITFIQGTLYWLPIINFTEKGGMLDGLPKYGTSKIEGDSLKLFAKLIKQWIELFRCAPSEVCLIKGYHFYVREWEHYDECTYKTVEILDSLENALKFVSLAIDNNYIIIHEGI